MTVTRRHGISNGPVDDGGFSGNLSDPLFHWRGRCGGKCPRSPKPVGLGLSVTQPGAKFLSGLMFSPHVTTLGQDQEPGDEPMSGAEQGQARGAGPPAHRTDVPLHLPPALHTL